MPGSFQWVLAIPCGSLFCVGDNLAGAEPLSPHHDLAFPSSPDSLATLQGTKRAVANMSGYDGMPGGGDDVRLELSQSGHLGGGVNQPLNPAQSDPSTGKLDNGARWVKIMAVLELLLVTGCAMMFWSMVGLKVGHLSGGWNVGWWLGSPPARWSLMLPCLIQSRCVDGLEIKQ